MKNRKAFLGFVIFATLIILFRLSFFVKSLISAAPPVVTVDTLVTNDTTPTLTGTISTVGSIVQITVAGTQYSATNIGNGIWTAEITTSLIDGVYDVIADATDPVDGSSSDATTNELTVDTIAPTVTVNQKVGQPDPTNIDSAIFTVVFSENVTGFVSTDITVSGTTGQVVSLTGSGTNYEAVVTGMTDEDIVTVSIPLGVATDSAGNGNAASTSTDNQVKYDANPSVTVEQKSGQPDPTNLNSIKFTVIFSENVTGLEVTDFIVTGSTTATVSAITGGPKEYEVEVTAMTDGDTIVLSLPATVVVDSDGNGNNASTSVDGSVKYDSTKPTVVLEQKVGQVDPTNMDSAQYTILFSEIIDEGTFSSSDITLTGTTGTVTTFTKIDNISWEFVVTGMSDGDIVVANILANKLTDLAGNNNEASTSIDNAVRYDISKPTVTVNQKTGQADPTKVNSAAFTITFSEVVTGLTITDVALSGSTTASVTSLTGSGKDYETTVTGMSDGDTVEVSIPSDIVEDIAGNKNLASTSTDNKVTYDITAPVVTVNSLITNDTTPTVSGTINDNAANIQIVVNGISYSAVNNGNGTWTYTILNALLEGIYDISATARDSAANSSTDSTTNELTIDTTAPTVTVNQSLSQADPTNVSPINYTIVFSEEIDATTFTSNDLTITGSGATISGFTQESNTTWSVALIGMSSNSTTTLSLGAAMVKDLAGNNNTASTTNDNQIIYDTTSPTVTVNQASTQVDPSNGDTIYYTIVFSEAINASTFTTDDLSLVAGTATVSNLTQDNQTTWTASITGMTLDYTISLSLPADKVQDYAGNNNNASSSTDNDVVWDHTPPVITVNPLTTNETSPLIEGTIDDSLAVIQVTINGINYNATNNEDGTWSLQTVVELADGTYNVIAKGTDTATNIGTDSTTGELVIDTVKPTVTINQKSGTPDPTNFDSAVFTVVFSESVVGFDSSDISISGTTGTVTSVTGSGSAYEVTVSGMTNNDIATATIPADKVVDLAGNSNIASTSTDNKVTYDNVAPHTSINKSVSQADPTNVNSARFTIVFPEKIDESSFVASDIVLANTTGTVTGLTGNGTIYEAVVTGMTSNDNVKATIPAGVVLDLAGNGNTASVSTDNTVLYDATPPVVTVNTLSTNLSRPTITGTIDDSEAKIRVTVNGLQYNATNNGNGTWSVTPAFNIPSGTYNVSVTAKDLAENIGTDNTNNELYIDSIRPTVSIVRNVAQNRYTNQDEALFTITFSKDIDDLTFVASGISLGATSGHISVLTKIDETHYEFKVVGMTSGDDVIATMAAGSVSDAVGNTNTSSSGAPNNIVTYDTTPPNTPFITVKIWDTFTPDNPQISFSAIDDESAIDHYEISVDGSAFSVQTSPYVVNLTPATTHTVTVRAYDMVGGVSVKTLQFSPAINILAPTTVKNVPITDTTIRVDGSSGQIINTVNISGAGSSGFNCGTLPATVPVICTGGSITSSGTLVVTATTSTGITVDDRQNYTIETVRPVPTIMLQSGQKDPTNVLPIHFLVRFSETVTGFDINDVTLGTTTSGTGSITSVTGSGTDYIVTVNNLTNGDIATITVPENAAIDVAGNLSAIATISNNTVTYDSVAPTISVNSLITNVTTPTISGTVNDASASIRVTVNGLQYTGINRGNGTWDVTTAVVLADGEYDIIATATDSAGNTASDSTTNELTVDTVKPTVTVNQKTGTPDPTNVNAIYLTIVFSEPVIGFEASDITEVGTTGSVTNLVKIDEMIYEATVTGMTSGDVTVSAIAPGSLTDVAGNPNVGSTSTDNRVSYDSIRPTVTINQKANTPDPTKVNSVIFVITFSEAVLGFDGSKIMLSGTSGTVTNLSTVGTNKYEATITGMTSGDVVIATIPENTVSDSAANGNTASTSTDNKVTYDSIAPIVTINNLVTNNRKPTITGTIDDPTATISIVVNSLIYTAVNHGTTWSANVGFTLVDGVYDVVATAKDAATNQGIDSTENELKIDTVKPTVTVNQKVGQADPTNVNSATYTVVFSEPINETSFVSGDITLTGTTGTVTTFSKIDNITWEFVVTGMTDGNTVVATIAASKVTDLAGNNNVASTSTDNSVRYDITKPTVTINQKVGQADPTNVNSATFTIVFSEDVTGFVNTDIVVSGTTGSITSFSGSGKNYEVTVTGMTDGDTVVLTIPVGVAIDAATNSNIASTSTDNSVRYDITKPTVTVNQKVGQADPTNVNSATYTVVFSEPINETSFVSGDITLTGTTGTVTTFSKIDNVTWEFVVTGMSDNNTVVATIGADKLSDPAGNGNEGSTSTDNSVRYDITKPTVTINQKVGQADPTNVNSAQFTIIFSEDINKTTFTPSDINIDGGAASVTGFVESSINEWTLTITGMTSVSTITVTIPANRVNDIAGNGNEASTSTDNKVTYDATAPLITVNTLFTQNRSPQLTGTINDNTASIKVTVNGTEYSATNNADGTWTLNSGIIITLSDGIYSVSAVATDIAGNVGTDSTSGELTVDNVSPVITVEETITNDHTPHIHGTVDDLNAILKVTVNGVTYNATYDVGSYWHVDITDTVPNGVYNVVATATDRAGNIGTDSTTDELTIDEHLLTVEVTLATNQVTPTNINNGEFIFTFFGDDVVASTFTQSDIVLVGTTTANITNFTQIDDDTWSITINNMTDGDVVSARLPKGSVSDIYGNKNQLSVFIGSLLSYDITPPVVTVNNLLTNNTSPELTGTINDNDATVKIEINGKIYTATNNKNGTWTLPASTITTLSDGIYNIVAHVTDKATNTSTDSTTNELEIDTTRPTVAINQKSSQKDPTNINSALFTVVFCEVIDELTFTSSDITLSGTTGAVTSLTKIGSSTYEIEVTYMTDGDVAKVEIGENMIFGPAGNGNIKSTSIDNTVTYDTTPPIIDIISKYGTSASPRLEGTTDDPTATIFVTVDSKTYTATNNGDGTWELPEGTIDTNLSDGDYLVSAIATDLAGNTTVTAVEKSITVDTIKPTGTLDPISEGINTSPELTGTVDDPEAEIKVTISGIVYTAANNQDGKWKLQGGILNLIPGKYNVIVTFHDKAGNVTEDPTKDELTILRADADIPTVDIISWTGNRPVVTGTYDNLNSQSLTVILSNVRYILGQNTQLTTDGNKWTLDLSNIETPLVYGIYDIAVEVTTRDGSVLSDLSSNELSLIKSPVRTGNLSSKENTNDEIVRDENIQEEEVIHRPERENEKESKVDCELSPIWPVLLSVLLLLLILMFVKSIPVKIVAFLIASIVWYVYTKDDCHLNIIWPGIYAVETLVGIFIKRKGDK